MLDRSSYPFDNEALMEKFGSEMYSVVESVQMFYEGRQFRVEVLSPVTQGGRFYTYTYELIDVSSEKDFVREAWCRMNVPDDDADTEEEAFAAALRWLSERLR